VRRTLTIGQAAARLGIEVDTLRRLERDGAIRAERTQGGHRRFDEAQVAQIARDRNRRRRTNVAPPSPTPRLRPRPVGLPVTRVSTPPRATPNTVAGHPREDDDRVCIDFDGDTSYNPAPQLAKPDTFDRDRLESIKSCGLAGIPFDVPATWRAKVIADLERFVSPAQFPKHVSHLEASNLVSARVEEVLVPYREQEARERRRS